MPRTTCSICCQDHSVPIEWCPGCIIRAAEVEMQEKDAEVGPLEGQWDGWHPGSTPPPHEANMRQTTAFVLLLMAAISTLLLIDSVRFRHETAGTPDETALITSQSEWSSVPRVVLSQRGEGKSASEISR